MAQGIRRHKSAGWVLLLLLGLAGCGEQGPVNQPESAEPTSASCFDPQTAGLIRGVVTWRDDLPVVRPFQARINLSPDGLTHQRVTCENPNAPVIDPQTKAVRGAIMYLRGVDPKCARPWDHPPVRVELDGYRIVVRQGEQVGHAGFVRRGDPLELVSRQAVFHSVHGRGAAFFGLTFPEPDHVRSRRLEASGLVELSSGAGYYWMRGYVFVAEHPYYTRTDTQGRFMLAQVPPGSYDLICWVPSWKEARHERDPETGLVTRLFFGPALEQVRRVNVGRPPVEADFPISIREFR